MSIEAIQIPGDAQITGPTYDELENLNARMKQAGMYSIDEQMGVTPLSKWIVPVGMTNLDTFSSWLDRRTADFLAMKAKFDLGDKPERDEMFEWVLAHAAVFSSIRECFRAARAGEAANSDQETSE